MNLADNKQRLTVQRDKIGNRPGILPARRDTRAPDLEVNASMRTARRGDGGAQELMRALGMVQQAGEDLTAYATAKHGVVEQQNIAQGFADQAAGVVDPEQEERSLGYRNAVTKGRTVNDFRKASLEFDTELRGIIERQDDPDLAVRQGEVSERIEKFYRDFAVDSETGEVKRSFKSPGALRYLAEAIQSSRADFTGNAMRRIEQRFSQEALTHYSDFNAGKIADTGTFDVMEARALLPATVTEEQIADATFLSINNGAEQLKSQGRYDEAIRLLASARGFHAVPVDAHTPDAARTGGVVSSAGGGSASVSFEALAAAVMKQESGGDPNAVSPKGAVGTMQTMQGTLTDPGFGVKPAKNGSAAEKERVGRDYLQAMLDRFKGDKVLALAAYNAGPGRADEWKASLAGKTVPQQIAAIPFKETRNYVRSILKDVGALGGSGTQTPAKPAPAFRLQKPGADPVTAYEQTGTLVPINGLETVKFTPEQRAKLNVLYEQKAAEICREWRQKRDEDQAHNAAELMAGVLGMGKATTRDDALAAMRSDAISADHFMTIYRGIEAQEDRRAAEQDRQEARHDRAEQRQRQDRINAVAGRILSPLLAGKANSGQTVSALMRTLPTLANDPEAAQAVMGTVLSVSGGWEKTVTENAEVRDAMTQIHRAGGAVDTRLSNAGILRSHLPAAKRELDALFDRAEAEFSSRVLKGENAEKVYKDVMTTTAAAETEITRRYAPRRPTGR